MPTGLHGKPSGQRFESSQSSDWMSCHDLSRFFFEISELRMPVELHRS